MELSDTDLMKNILNVGRRRERAVYYRPDGTPTLPLPADMQSKIYYMSKGFTTERVNRVDAIQPSVSDGKIRCPLCDFITESAFGLQSHLRKHTKKEKKE